MLDEFCDTLSDAAQLKIALRFGKMSLAIWDNYFSGNADAIEKVNVLIKFGNRIKGGAERIEPDFLSRALKNIEKNFEQAVKEKFPVASIKNNPQLKSMFVTSMQFLTNPEWDSALPQNVRLVFTSVWNILTWIVFKRKSESGETHIYIAINQSIDALVSGNILTFEQANAILSEYENEKKSDDEEAAWLSGSPETPADNESLTPDEVYRKIIGENIVKDPPQSNVVKEILRQMREEAKSFWDKWEEYYSGTCNYYSYNDKENSFWKTETDVIVGSFHNEYAMSEGEMSAFISGISLHDLRENGFEV